MRKTNQTILAALLGACLLAPGACSKRQPSQPPSMDISGVKVDLPKLQQAVAAGPNDAKAQVAQASAQFRYGRYASALELLTKAADDPALSADQKKCLDQVIGQGKEVITKAGPTRQ